MMNIVRARKVARLLRSGGEPTKTEMQMAFDRLSQPDVRLPDDSELRRVLWESGHVLLA